MGHIGITSSSDGPFFGELPWLSSDDDLLLEGEKGNQEALWTLYEKRRTEIGELVAALLGRRAGLEEIVAETFLRAFRAINRIGGSVRFDICLRGLAVAATVQYVNENRNRGELEKTPSQPEPAHDDVRVCPEAICRQLDDLPLIRRTVFIMAEMQGLDVPSIAGILGAPRFAVAIILFLARRRFYRGLFGSTTL